MKDHSSRKLLDKEVKIVGPQGWDLVDHIATRLWGKWAKSNIQRSQRTINRMCGHERLKEQTR